MISLWKMVFGSGQPLRHAGAPERRRVDLVLLLVDGGSDGQNLWAIEALTSLAEVHGGVVLQVAGSLLMVAFSGVAGLGGTPHLHGFLSSSIDGHGEFVRILYGQVEALVGRVGSSARFSYTVIPDHYPLLLARLTALPAGGCESIGGNY